MAEAILKACKKCGEHHSFKQCQVCKKISTAAWAVANKSKMIAAGAAYRARNPEKTKAREKNYRVKYAEKIKASRVENSESIKAYQLIYCAAHKEETKARSAAYYKENVQHVSLINKAYRVKNALAIKKLKAEKYAANPESVRVAGIAYRALNTEKIQATNAKYYLENTDKLKLKVVKWQSENPEKYRVYSQNRRAQKFASGEKLSIGLPEKLLVLQRGKCACCKVDLEKVKKHLDHVVPLAKGGPHIDANMQFLCASCNCSKSAKDPLLFMQSRGFLL